MPRKHPQPFWREGRKCWFVQLGKKQVRLDPDRGEAFRLYHELMTRPPEARRFAGDSPPLALDVLDAFLDWTRANKAARTYDWYRDFILHLKDAIPPSIAASDLRPHHASRVMDARSDWGPNTKHGFARAVTRAFNWAVKQGLVASNPLAGLEKPRPEARETHVTPEDFRRVMDLAQGDGFRDVLAFAWETGARPQEIRAIEARHVRFGEGRAVLPRPEAKGKRAARVIYLTDEAASILRRLCEANPSGPVFRNSEGNPWTKDAINCAFRRLARRLGGRLHLGAFRKGWATEALKNGVDVLTTAHLMGHANSNMLAKHYARVQADPAFMAGAARRARGR